MEFMLLWILLAILKLSSASLDKSREEIESVHNVPQQYSYGDIWLHPYYSLKEYHTFQDAKIYVLNVPVFIKEMRLFFHYHGMYLHSHEPCNNSINILLQHGSPAIPYRDEINTDGVLYNNTDFHQSTVSLYHNKNKTFLSPLPGKWYVTAFLPYVKKDQKIREKGLSKVDEKCLSALSVEQVLVTPLRSPVVLAKSQTWRTTARFPTSTYYKSSTYYKYFVSGYSKELRVQLNNSCSEFSCSLKLSLSLKSLPESSSLSCLAPCVLTVTWPQPHSYYYIEVSGTSQTYAITADHTECLPETPGCPVITKMSSLGRKLLATDWNYYIINETSLLSLNLDPDYVGTAMTFLLWPYHRAATGTYKMCISKDTLPIHIGKSDEISKKFCGEKSDGGVIRMQVLFPQSGTWYIKVDIQSHDIFPAYVLHAKTQACLSNCNKHGYCEIKSGIGVSYGACACDYGYSGFTCSGYQSLDVLAVCLLTISNIAFVPGIIVACSRRFFPEAIVYLFNMYCSTVYHACDSHGYCMYDYNTLQLSDFLASILSVWFTTTAMLKLPSLWQRTLNILAVLCIFVGVQLSRFGFLIIAIPGGVGALLVFISFGCRSYNRRRCYPNPKRWLFFLLPASILCSTAVGIYAGLETTSNYKYLHSIWHIAIALCIPLYLPSVRKPKLYVDYNTVGEVNDENFRDSDDSLVLTARNTADINNADPESQEIAFPQLVNT